MAQETHLILDYKYEIKSLFGKRMEILFSADSDNLMSKGGVAVVLNKNLINTQGARMTEIIPGRVILVSVNWHINEVINILTIYAPNVTHDS